MLLQLNSCFFYTIHVTYREAFGTGAPRVDDCHRLNKLFEKWRDQSKPFSKVIPVEIVKHVAEKNSGVPGTGRMGKREITPALRRRVYGFATVTHIPRIEYKSCARRRFPSRSLRARGRAGGRDGRREEGKHFRIRSEIGIP